MHRVARLEVLFTPNEFCNLTPDRLRTTVCVVFDVLRATTSIITALAHGATAVRPVLTIDQALEARRHNPQLLLGGERNGLRILAQSPQGIDFDFGNSPSEYATPLVRNRPLAVTTTNGTRALNAALPAQATFVASFLNLNATAQAVRNLHPQSVLIIGAGTYEEAALEDTLAAGALASLLEGFCPLDDLADSALIAQSLYHQLGSNLPAALALSRNGRRLLKNPQLSRDVAFAAQLNSFPIIASLQPDGWIVAR